MRLAVCLSPLLLVAFISSSSFALTASDLQDNCRYLEKTPGEMTTQEQILTSFCVGYIFGAYEGFTLRDYPKGHICLPEEVDAKQIGLVVHKYLQDHPERLHIPAQLLIAGALQGAFPCK